MAARPQPLYDEHPLSYPLTAPQPCLSCTSDYPSDPPVETSWFDDTSSNSDAASTTDSILPSLYDSSISSLPSEAPTPLKAAALLDLAPSRPLFTKSDWFSQFPPRLDPSDPTPSLAPLADLPLYDAASHPRPFASLFPPLPGHRYLLVFIRHFFCPACRAYLSALQTALAQHETEGAPTSVAVVGCGDPRLIRQYKAVTGCAFPVFADPERRVFRALGMKSGVMGGRKPEYLRGHTLLGSLKKATVEMMEDWERAKLGGNILQNGGEFLIKRGEVVWCHRMRNYKGHAEVDVVRRVLGVKR